MKYSSPLIAVMILSMTGLLSAADAPSEKQTPDQKQPTKARPRRKPSAYPPKLEGAKVEVYKKIGDVKLNIYIYNPKDHKADEKKPAIVFFFGGGWRGGSPKQFEHQCRYIASRGMVAMTADYRVASRHQTKALHCVRDAKSAVRWIRQNAKRLGVDPERVAAGGGSAGGHIAACTGVIQGQDEPGEDTKISSVPNAMVLFNPVMQLAPIKGESFPESFDLEALKDRMGIDPAKLSPAHDIRKGLPPAIIFFGANDRLLAGAKVFDRLAKAAGNRCELRVYQGQKHGFFNHGRNGNKPFVQTVRAADEFLTSLGWLEGKPTIELETK